MTAFDPPARFEATEAEWSMPVSGRDEGKKVAKAKLPVTGPPARGEDPELDSVADFFQQPSDLEVRFGRHVRRALDEVIATARTRRWHLDQCNDQEKAFVGVNVENVIRADYDFRHGQHGQDFDVAGVDVDCKWSRSFNGWQIPNEAVGHICLLVYGDDLEDEMAVGLLRIREELLVGGNRDEKRTIQSPGGLSEVRWLVDRGPSLPENFLMNLGEVDRDAILSPKGGDGRARALFERCEGLIIHRHTIESIGQQVDEARRFRGETRKHMNTEGFEVFNGFWKKQKERARELGGPVPRDNTEWICLRTDGTTPERRRAEEPARLTEVAATRAALKAELEVRRLERKDARAAKKRVAEAAVASVVQAAAKNGAVEQSAVEQVADIVTRAAMQQLAFELME